MSDHDVSSYLHTEPTGVLIGARAAADWAAGRAAALPTIDDTRPRICGLTKLETEIIEFAVRHADTLPAGYVEEVTRDLLGLTEAQYTARLNALTDDPRAHAYAPRTMSLLRARRNARYTAAGRRRLADSADTAVA